MSVSILKWIDVVGKKRLADIELCKSEMQAFVYVGNIDTQDLWKNKNIELDYESLVRVIPLRGLSDRRTTIKKIDDGYAIWGKVVTLIELESGRICVDL